MTKNSRDKGNEPVVNFDSWAYHRRDLLKITGLGLTALAGTKSGGPFDLHSGVCPERQRGPNRPGTAALERP